jgi:ribosomal protein S18 acetylase RimI-like enzyme
MQCRFITPLDPLYAAECRLRFELLREPLRMTAGSERSPDEDTCRHLVAVEEGRVVGCVLFRAEGRSGRLFQMAVVQDHQGQGIGSHLIRTMEERLIAEGFDEAYLHARDHAVGFYGRLGYRVEGEPFIEVGIPHRKMRKKLTSAIL